MIVDPGFLGHLTSAEICEIREELIRRRDRGQAFAGAATMFADKFKKFVHRNQIDKIADTLE